MDEMQILVPVAVKSKLTEQLKATLLAEIEQNLKRVDHDMSQLEAVAPLRAQYEAQKVQMQQMKDKFLADKDHLERLTIGAELNRAPMNRLVTIHIGDDMNELLGGEILVEDGKIVEFRN